MMDPRNEQEEEVKKYYSVPVHNFVRRFKLINATFRKEAGSTDVLIDVTRQRGWIRIVSVVCLRTENIDSINNKKKEGKKGRKKSERKENIDASTARYTRENGFNEKRFVWAFYYHHLDVLYYNYR